jgi:predicted ATPase
MHDLLVRLAERLQCRVLSNRSLRNATSISLKGAVLGLLKAEPRLIFLEDVEHADPRIYRFLQEVYHLPGCCLVVTSRSRESLGYLGKLLWDPREEIALKPLNRVDCKMLFEAAASRFGLCSLDLEDFRRKVLASAHGNPGQILAMCRLAARPEYQDGRHIMFVPLRMDVLPAFVR